MEHIFIEGFGFSNFRSYATLQCIGPCKKINIIVGQNNLGKSNILHFISNYYSKRLNAIKNQRNKPFEIARSDLPQNNATEHTMFALCWQLGGPTLTNAIAAAKLHEIEDPVKKVPAIDCLLSDPKIVKDGAWFHYKNRGANTILTYSSMNDVANTAIARVSWDRLAEKVSGRSQNSLERSKAVFFENFFIPEHVVSPNIYMVSAVRKVSKGDFSSELLHNPLDGSCGINMLAHIKDPPTNMRHQRKRYDAFLKFARGLLNNNDAEFSIPSDQNSVHVIMDGKDLPLEQLGTGLQEIILVALAGTLVENSVVCLEEPEIHLHPHLQRKLIQYLKDYTSNQYFITTHSAQIMDTPDAAVFHVSMENGQSIITATANDEDKFSICSDLGYKASDLLQANTVIWVEGPSDRLYILKWLQQSAPDLREGLHFSVMFFGGGLHSYLTMEEPPENDEIEKFVALVRINRNAVIVLDSDRADEDSSISKNKERLVKEISEGANRLCWITQGREIENYLPAEVFAAGVKAVHPKWSPLVDLNGQFSNITKWKNSKGNSNDIAKSTVAHEVVKNEKLSLDVLDLKERIDDLVGFIKRANHIT